MAKAKTSKSALIREALKAAPDKPATEIAKELKVSTGLVYNVKANSARKKRRAAAKKAGGTEVNKAELIRQTAKSLPKPVRPRDIIAALKDKGITVSSAQVSKTLRSAGYRRKRRGHRTATASAPDSGNGLNLDALIAAKALIEKVGGVDVAEEALRAMKELG
jgi:transposase